MLAAPALFGERLQGPFGELAGLRLDGGNLPCISESLAIIDPSALRQSHEDDGELGGSSGHERRI